MATMDAPGKSSEGNTLHRAMTRAQEQAPSSAQLKKWVTWATACIVALVLGGIALVGTSMFLCVAIPLLIVFSPVLIPVGIVLVLSTGGIVSAVGFGVVVFSAFSWLYNYFKGRDPPGADRVDAARDRLVSSAREFKEWASNYSSQMRAAPSA